MKKIKSKTINPKDRVVCVTVTGAHKFYYQPFDSKERLYLFTTADFSGSVFAYFRDKGRRCMDRQGFSLTIKELYDDRKCYRNPKIAKIFDRLPVMIDYVLREQVEQREQAKCNKIVKESNKVSYEDREFAA